MSGDQRDEIGVVALKLCQCVIVCCDRSVHTFGGLGNVGIG